MSDPPVHAVVVDGIGRLTLDRPDAGNAIDLALARALAEVTAEWANRRDLRVVVLRGRGARFCVGGDLKAFSAEADLPTHLTAVTAHLHLALARLARLPAPVVAAVQGSAAGAGFSLAASADVLLAGVSARFVLAYSKVGLTPDGSGTWYLPRHVGLHRALDLALTNRVLDATEAERIGLVSRVVADDDLDAETEAVVAELARGPAGALAATKALVRASAANPLEHQLERETAALAAAAGTTDAVEGIAAFLAKRPPEFG